MLTQRSSAWILLEAVIKVAGKVAGVAALNLPRRVAEAIPDALALAVGPGRSLNLEGRG